ncbi:MAG TPA: hypothetical protein VFR47_19325 [Anaerolineales bacterium]|nr:hypothetical protein [Anaerolineales bacterium]
MTSQMVVQENPVPRASWIILALVATLTILSGLYVGLTPVGSQTELSGRTWEEFAAADPEVARIYAMDLVLLGMTLTAFAILGTIVALIPYRRGERWAWFSLWLIPLVHGGVALRMLIDQYDAAYVYLGLFVISLIGILIPIRRFL